MSLYEKIVNGEEKISLVGLGYVGMPIAIEFTKRGCKVVGYDLNAKKIEVYKSGIDPTNEVGDDAIKETTVEFTSDEKMLQTAAASPERFKEIDYLIKAVSNDAVIPEYFEELYNTFRKAVKL